MKYIHFFVLLFLLLACQSRTELKKIDPYILLHDNSSKVWFVDEMIRDNKDYTPFLFRNRLLIVFHENRNAYFYRIKDLSSKGGLKSMYWMDMEKKELGFQIGTKELLFTIGQVNRKNILLLPKRNSYPYILKLIPFPEY